MDFVRIVNDKHVYRVPNTCIKSIADIECWIKSDGYSEYCSFLKIINEAVQGTSNSDIQIISDNIQKILEILDKLEDLIKEHPPINQPQRFGNAAFKQWYQSMTSKSLELISQILSQDRKDAAEELKCYFIDSFGNSTRIDYGTGHEMAFVLFLLCLCKIGYFNPDDKSSIACKIFDRYIRLVRCLQQTYRMEPAGSHGVWSLDDYQFIPFIWGSSQLIGHKVIKPSMFLQPEILEKHAKDFMYLSSIEYIKKVKIGPFHEHSNQLWDISGFPDWKVINDGLIRMYKAEVLAKFPIIQHVKFGSLISIKIKKAVMRKNIPSIPRFHASRSGGDNQISSYLRRNEN